MRSAMRVGVPIAEASRVVPVVGAVADPSPTTFRVATVAQLAVTCRTDASTPHTPGAWVELIASTAADSDGFGIIPGTNAIRQSGVDTSTLVDIGVGEAGSEVVVMSGLPCYGNAWGSVNLAAVPVLVRIPKGSRVAVRAQGAILDQTTVSTVFRLFGARWPAGQRSPSKLVTMGADTAGSGPATTLSDAGSNNAQGAWTEVVAATPQPFRGIIAAAAPVPGTTVVNSSHSVHIDVGVGASGSERVVIHDLYFGGGNQEDLYYYGARDVWFGHVPAGTRLAARMMRVAAGTHGVVLWGIPY